MKYFLIVPSILSADFARLGNDINQVIAAGAKMIHFDVMDNHYVPNLSIGPMVLKALRNYGITIPIDVHLMAKPIDRLILDFGNVGANNINIHVESTEHINRSLQLIKDCGCRSGLVFNPATTFEYLKYVMDKIDTILLMSVNPGFSGQSFLSITLDKIRYVRNLIDNSGYDIRLAVDGGINTENITEIANAGADTFIIGSAIFGNFDYCDIMNNMYNKLSKIKHQYS